MNKLFNKYREYYHSNIRLAYPVVISQLGHTLVALSDSLIIGRKGALSLAAVSLGNAVFIVIMMLGIGISFGLTPIIAQVNGRKENNRCGALLSNSLIVNLVTGFLLCGFTFLIIKLLPLFGEPPQVVKLAIPFMVYLGISIIPLMVFLTFKQFAEGLGFTKQAMRISIAGNVLNIILGIILVFGLFGIKSLGIIGVGISTLTDRFLMGIVMGIYVLKSPRFKSYLVEFKWISIKWEMAKDILKIGIPVALQYFFEVSAFTFSAVMIGWTGANPLAAHQVAISLAAITYMMASGIAAAASIQAGNSFGQKDFIRMRFAAISSYHLVLVFMSFTAVLFIALHHVLPALYIKDSHVIKIASNLLIIAAFFQLFDGLQVVGLGILRGISDVRIPTLLTFVAYWIIGLPMGYFFGFKMGYGALGVWTGLLLGLGMAAIMLAFRFQHKSKKFLLLAKN